MMTLWEVAADLSRRMTRIFLRGPDGARPVHGGDPLFRDDPHWRDLVLFYEYFHGDNGRGVGANHQTGWTGLIGKCIEDIATNHSRRISDALMPAKLHAEESLRASMKRQVERVGGGQPR